MSIQTTCEPPRSLPYCTYPQAREIAQHGVQKLPATLPLVDFTRAQPYRSHQYTTIAAAHLTPAQVLQMAAVVGTSFARREPQARYLQPPQYPPAGLLEACHTDPFGSESFGPWTKERLLYWFIRLLVLTDPTQPKPALQINTETLMQSLTIVDHTGQVIGGALNETMPALEVAPVLRQDDLFLEAVSTFVAPVFTLLATQDAEALEALCAQYPAFREAYAQGKVGHHFMVARPVPRGIRPLAMPIWSSKRPIHGRVPPAKCWGQHACILRPIRAATRCSRALRHCQTLLAAPTVGFRTKIVAVCFMSCGWCRPAPGAQSTRERCIKRPEEPTDVTGTVGFLASDDSAFITGQAINVNGGATHD